MRRLSTKDQFIALLYAQFSGATSLREIVGNFSSHSARLYHLGSRPVSRSTLADANTGRSSAVFSGLFAHLAANACRGLRQKAAEAVHLIDSTGIRLSGMGADWAHFSHNACGAKAHIIYDAQANYRAGSWPDCRRGATGRTGRAGRMFARLWRRQIGGFIAEDEWMTS